MLTHRLAGILALAALVLAGPAAAGQAPAPSRIVSLSPTATEDLFAVGAGKQVVAVDNQSDYPKNAPITKLSGFTPNAEAIAGYNPDLVVVSYDADHIVEALGKLKIPVLVEPTASTLAQAYAQIGAARRQDRPCGQGGGARRLAEAADRGDRRLGPAPPPGDHRLPRARARSLLGDLEDVHRPHLHPARAEGHRRRGRQGRLGLPAALGGVHRRRRSAPDRPRGHGLLRAERRHGRATGRAGGRSPPSRTATCSPSTTTSPRAGGRGSSTSSGRSQRR